MGNQLVLPDVFTMDTMWSTQEIDSINDYLFDSLGSGRDCVDEHGVWKGHLVVNECPFDIHEHDFLVDLVVKPLRELFVANGANYDVVLADRVTLYKPWDIHTDYEKHESNTSYNCLIPLEDVQSRTIVFDQQAEYRHFYMYKEQHEPVSDPVEEEFWNDNLSHCWDEDRMYLTVKEIGPFQRKGQAQLHRRTYFHSSDNFSKNGIESKKFLQLYLNEV